MKKKLMAWMPIGITLLMSYHLHAQDVITYHTQETKEIVILKEKKKKIKYVLANQTHKKVYKESVKKIYSIEYVNGEVRYFQGKKNTTLTSPNKSANIDWKVRRKRDSVRRALNINIAVPLVKRFTYEPQFNNWYIQYEWMPNPYFSWGARVFYTESSEENIERKTLIGDYIVGNGRSASRVSTVFKRENNYQSLGLGILAKVHPFSGIGKLSVGLGIDLMMLIQDQGSSFRETAWNDSGALVYKRYDPFSSGEQIGFSFSPHVLVGWKFLIGDHLFVEPIVSAHYLFHLSINTPIQADATVSVGFTF